MNDINITKATATRYDDINWNNLEFGKYYADHMFVAEYRDGKWQNKRIMPYGPMQFEPALTALHYGQSIFEGLKAFRSANGGVNIFRPDMNYQRLNNSAEMMCMPRYDSEEELVEVTKELVRLDSRFVPENEGESLYIRPVLFGSSNLLKVKASDEYLLIIMTSPVGSYYDNGLNPVPIMVTDQHVRAARHGIGNAKTAANYAASLKGGKEAYAKGFSQVLWLDACDRKRIDEVGAMNIMFVIGDELVTPSLQHGTILPGITRYSVLDLAKEMGMKVTERDITIDEVFKANAEGQLKEIFGTGTAAVISPVGALEYQGERITINNEKIGPVAQKFYDTITGIQYGNVEDTFGWNIHVDC